MRWRQAFNEMYFGFESKKSRIVEMDVSFLYDLAYDEKDHRTEDSGDSKSVLFEEGKEENPQLRALLDGWDDSKYEPVILQKEGCMYFIHDGFHRIVAAALMGKSKIKVELQEGHFVIGRHISLLDLSDLCGVLAEMFSKSGIRSFKSLKRYLSDPKFDKDKMKRTFIGYGKVE